MVAMATPSERAPHTCGRIGNGNISHLGKELACALPSDQGVKNAAAEAPEVCAIRSLEGLFASGSRGGLCGIFCLIWSFLFLPEVMTYII